MARTHHAPRPERSRDSYKTFRNRATRRAIHMQLVTTHIDIEELD